MKKYLKSGFIQNVGKLASGTLISQLFMFLAMPVLARIYLPESFGALANFTSIVAISSCFITLRYEQAIFLAKSESERRSILSLTFFLLFSFTILISIVSLIIFWTTDYFEELGIIWYLIPIGCCMIGLNQVLVALLSKTEHFGSISVSKVSQSISTISFQYILKAWLSKGLIFGYLIGSFIGLIPLLKRANITFKIPDSLEIHEIKRLAKRYSNFPRYQAFSALLNGVSSTIPIFLLTALYSPEITGLYSFSHRLLFVPITFVGQAVRQVFMQKASNSLDNLDSLKSLYFKVSKILIAVGIVSFSIFYFFSNEIVFYLFGPNWESSSKYISILCFWVFFLFINPPSVACLTLLEKQRFNLYYDILLVLSRIGAIYYGFYFFNDPLMSILLFTAVGALFNIFLISYVSLNLRNKDGN